MRRTIMLDRPARGAEGKAPPATTEGAAFGLLTAALSQLGASAHSTACSRNISYVNKTVRASMTTGEVFMTVAVGKSMNRLHGRHRFALPSPEARSRDELFLGD